MPKKVGPFRVLGRFNSTRSPDIVYTVKEHLDISKDTGKRISCNCPGWRFSIRSLGHHECKHTRHVDAPFGVSDDHQRDTGLSVLAMTTQAVTAWSSFSKTEIGHALKRRKDSPKRRLAAACQEAGVQLSDPAFRALLKALRPYLQGDGASVATPTSTPDDDVLRVITLD
jgi:hypothetical protein